MIAGSMILPRIPGRRWLLFRMELMGLISMVNGIMRFLSALVSMGIWVQAVSYTHLDVYKRQGSHRCEEYPLY